MINTYSKALHVWVFLGGGLGAVLRFALTPLFAAPWGTMAVNAVGSALLAACLHPSVGLSEAWRAGLCTGLLGGFTTYSTFNRDRCN